MEYIIYPFAFNLSRIVASWMDKREVKSEKANLSILFDKYLPTCVEKVQSSFKKMTAIPEVSLVQTLLYIMEGLLVPENTPPDSPKELYELYLVFACVWAFGGAMSQDQVLGIPFRNILFVVVVVVNVGLTTLFDA